MRHIELVPGIHSSVIGFGCAPILGAVGHREAGRAIDVALDVGINHFDLARSYGYGRAEAMVGCMLRGKRDQVVLATKFGIEASPAAYFLSPLKPLIRALRRRRSPGTAPATSAPNPAERPVERPSNRMASLLHRRVPLEPATMVRSLEASLRALGTDRVDYFFVHEPTGNIARVDELAAAAEQIKKQGKIRAWGLAFSYKDLSVHALYLRSFDVLQFNCSPGVPDYRDVVAERGGHPNIFFSPFRHRTGSGEAHGPAAILRRLVLDFPRSVVLCSMFSEAHIRANAEAVP